MFSVALPVLVKPLHLRAHRQRQHVLEQQGVLGMPQFNFACSRHTHSHMQSNLSAQAPPPGGSVPDNRVSGGLVGIITA